MMMQTITFARLGGLLTCLAAVLPLPAHACSLANPVGGPIRSSRVLSFIGRAASDTMLAGVGDMRVRHREGFDAGPVYGQVVRVERLSPAASPELRAALERAGGRVVLVPWDYMADCSPIQRRSGARWLADGASGLFEMRLRERAHWANDIPTLDVVGIQFWPYVEGLKGGMGFRGMPVDDSRSSQPWLSPAELLTLHALRPTMEEVEARPDSAFAPLRAWAVANPVLAAREPAVAMLRYAERMVADVKFRARAVPLAGTYHVTVWIAGGVPLGSEGAPPDSATFYVRTARHPTSPLRYQGIGAGMYVIACTAPSLDALPTRRSPGECTPGSTRSIQGYFAFGDSVWTDAAGRRTRPGSVDVVHGDSAVQQRFRTSHSLRPVGDRRFLPGVFTETGDGRVEFEMTLGPADRPAVRVTAVRISTDVIER